MRNLLKKIPNVNSITTRMKENIAIENELLLKESINQILDKLRKEILDGKINDFSEEELIIKINELYILKNKPKHRQCINATGTIIHTNLGRSLLSDKQMSNINVLKGYNNLEFDIDKQKRGSRYLLVEDVICKVCQCESAVVVNNNAAAVMLVLNEFAYQKEVIVSNSELVEIGGSFRIPEIINLSQAIMKNVGTTNKTKLMDYYKAINENTGLLAKIHQSNFYMEGFVSSVEAKELVDYRDDNNIDVVIYEDLASGAIFDLSKYGIDKEPTVLESVQAGVDVISFSGDKLLGGVQAGIIIGKKEYINRLKKNQLLRTLRPSSLILNIVESTFQCYLNEKDALSNIPTLKYIVEDKGEVKKRAEYLTSMIKDNYQCQVIETKALIGGGCMPKTTIESYGVCIENESDNELKTFLANSDIPIITIVTNDSLIIDCKVISEQELEYVIKQLNNYKN